MEGYDSSTYGDRFADVYDDWYGAEGLIDLTDITACTERLTALARGGPVLELGVGSGRLALPLAARGVEVHGIDVSEAMLARLRAKPGADAIHLTLGDMAELALPEPPVFTVVLAAFNTLFNLVSPDAQQQRIQRVAELLAPEGLFVIEAFVPAEPGEAGPAGSVTPRHITVDEVVLSVSRHDEHAQTITGQHIHVTEQGIRLRPWHLRYARPTEIDAMAEAAGLTLAWRHADWDETPFGPDAGVHVSVYRRGNVRTVLAPRLRMSQLRLNPLTGRWVTVAAERASRPGELISRQLPVEADPSRKCPFCPGNEEATPPALETYGPGGTWLVRVVPNLYPAFEGNEPLRVQNLGPVFTQASASGVHEVLVFSPEHTHTWADLDDKHAGLAMAAIRDRMEDHARRTTVRYTQAIVNAGREAGASLVHPHGQVLGIPFVPGEIAEEEAGFRRFGESCLLCTMAEAEHQVDHRVVFDDDKVLVVCPYWSGAPYEMLVMPRTHEVHLENTSPGDVVAVGRAIRDALALLRTKIGDTAYNLVFHTAPHHHEGPFHWHVHIIPRLTSLAGFEQGTGVMINIVAPELAARHLKG